MQLKLPVTFGNNWIVAFKLNKASRLSVADANRASIDRCRGKGITITLEVDHIESTHRHLDEIGIDPGPIRNHPWGAMIIHVDDPQDNRLEFWSPDQKQALSLPSRHIVPIHSSCDIPFLRQTIL